MLRAKLVELFTSKKTITAIVTLIGAGVGRLGFDADLETVGLFVSVGVTLILSFAAQDAGKEKAKIEAQAAADDHARRNGEAGHATVLMVSVLIAVLIPVLVLYAGCSALSGAARDAKAALIDCTKKQVAPTVRELRRLGVAMLSNALSSGRVQWGPVRDLAQNLATDVGRCVLADAVARALQPKPADPNAPKLSPLEADPAELRAGFKQLSVELYGGASFKTESGDL